MKNRKAYKLKGYDLRRLKLLSEFVEGKQVLDIGYAARPNPYLSQYHTAGYDLIRPAPAQQTRYSEEIEGDVKDIQNVLSGRTFDAIICGELIEHLENPYAFLNDLQSLLNDSGRLILSTPNPLGFPCLLCETFNIKRFFYSSDHLYLFSPRWVRRLLEKTGYHLTRIKPVGFWGLLFTLPICPAWMSWQIIYVATKKKA